MTVAAVAEALHVDGRYAESARMWLRLGAECPGVVEYSLKAALALYGTGDRRSGDFWLRHAELDGLPRHEALYVTGQLELGHGRPAAAERALAASCAAGGGGRALTALGAALWQRGEHDEAQRVFHQAGVAADPDPLAELNLLSAALAGGAEIDGEAAAARVAEVEVSCRHRPEPFVIWSRLRRRAGDARGARDGLARARLRTAPQVRLRGIEAGGPRSVHAGDPAVEAVWAHIFDPSAPVPGHEAAEVLEASRALWQRAVTCRTQDAWLIDGLARYAAHVVDSAWTRGEYERALELGGGRLPRDGVASLSGEARSIKAGWVFRMLAHILGGRRFGCLLQATFAAGQAEPTVLIAVASYLHGSSLRWFANQWLYTSAEMTFACEGLQVRCAGAATPGAAVELAAGSAPRRLVDVDIDPPASALSVPPATAIDPELVFYASRQPIPEVSQ